MKYNLFFLLWLSFIGHLSAQTYTDTILQYRQQYAKELLTDPRVPVKPSDVRYLRYFPPAHDYRVWANYTETPGNEPFMVPTHSGKEKPFKQCGILTFYIHDTMLNLHVYQIINLINRQASENELFIPFTDETNYTSTYAGGRYIDMTTADIKDGICMLDFNKCYNPLCAYGEGFSCPIPPRENFLPIEIKAGEKMYVKNMRE